MRVSFSRVSSSTQRRDFSRNSRIFESPHKNYVVNQIIQYFNKHYSEKISLDQIAQNMYLSTLYISKLFKSETGDTPINYLIQLRMEKARKLMETEPASSIQSIASQVGYEDAYYFSKLFKKHFGVSPSKYRSTFKI
ncbi:MAG: helix-turn-helix transcriptional regulator [Ruminococcus sp.]|nr:helix-turn-helix transcriptional regulator [Ruminococcus sp.]